MKWTIRSAQTKKRGMKWTIRSAQTKKRGMKWTKNVGMNEQNKLSGPTLYVQVTFFFLLIQAQQKGVVQSKFPENQINYL